MRIIAAIFSVIMGFPLSAAEKRIALVVGNSEYSAVTRLDNATNDAQLLANSLENLGFEVTRALNTSQSELKEAVATFGRSLRAGGPDAVGLFYYAGHGVQSFGANYLLPIDANLTVAADLDLVGLEASSVLRQMASARNSTNIVILDACRNNPFEDIPDMNDNGLAEMKAPTGTFLAYATAPGAVAFDGMGGNSPFTKALAEAIQTKNLPIERVFKQVRVGVLNETNGAQTPWDTSSLTQEFVFRSGPKLTDEEVEENLLWQSLKNSDDSVQMMLFLRSYPEGRHAETARKNLARLMAQEFSGENAEGEAAEEITAAQPEISAAAPAPDVEIELMELARSSGKLGDYEAYLDAFPTGIFAELVKIEIAALKANASEDPDGPAPKAEPVIEAAESNQEEEPVVVLFDVPIAQGIPEIVGKTIMQVTELSPIFPPIEGLPEPLWKTEKCSSCHQWTRHDLCEQAKFYLTQNTSRSTSQSHPFGGSFKRNLKHWAGGGCK